MLFNCINCCKAISSQATTCPYCLVATENTIREMALNDEDLKIPVTLAAKRKVARIKRLTFRVNRVRKAFPGTIAEIVTNSQIQERIQRV